MECNGTIAFCARIRDWVAFWNFIYDDIDDDDGDNNEGSNRSSCAHTRGYHFTNAMHNRQSYQRKHIIFRLKRSAQYATAVNTAQNDRLESINSWIFVIMQICSFRSPAWIRRKLQTNFHIHSEIGNNCRPASPKSRGLSGQRASQHCFYGNAQQKAHSLIKLHS